MICFLAHSDKIFCTTITTMTSHIYKKMEIHHAYKKICSMPFMKKGSQKVQGHYLFLIKTKLILAVEAKERIIIAGHSLSMDPT